MASTEPTYILEIEWDRPSPDSPKLPGLVGPFKTRTEAEEWQALNIGNGSSSVRELAWPYSSGGVTFR